MIFFIALFITIVYISALFYLPFLFPYVHGNASLALETILIVMNVFLILVILSCIEFFLRYTRTYNMKNADVTIALSKEKHRVKSLEDIGIEKCGGGIWKLYVNDNTYEINLKGYLFQLSFIMSIMVRLVYYRYIKHGKRKNFALHAKVPVYSLELQIKIPNNRIIKKKLIWHNHLWHSLMTQIICHYQATYNFNNQYRRSFPLLNYIFRQNEYVKYTEEWWVRGVK